MRKPQAVYEDLYKSDVKFNLWRSFCVGGYRPLREFIEAARAVIAPQCDVAYGAADADVFSLQPSVEKIRRDTEWQPVTDFVDGLQCGDGLLS